MHCELNLKLDDWMVRRRTPQSWVQRTGGIQQEADVGRSVSWWRPVFCKGWKADNIVIDFEKTSEFICEICWISNFFFVEYFSNRYDIRPDAIFVPVFLNIVKTRISAIPTKKVPGLRLAGFPPLPWGPSEYKEKGKERTVHLWNVSCWDFK